MVRKGALGTNSCLCMMRRKHACNFYQTMSLYTNSSVWPKLLGIHEIFLLFSIGWWIPQTRTSISIWRSWSPNGKFYWLNQREIKFAERKWFKFSILNISWSKIYITIEYVFLASNIMSSIFVLFCILVQNISGAICWLFLASQLLQSLVHNISIILASLYSAKAWTKEKQKQ